jgi:hypothetical protein
MSPLTVESLALTPSQPLRGDAAAFRNGAVIQARVLAMLEANVARLSILGQTIDVSTPVALKPGTSLPISVENSGDGLKLFIKGDTSQAQAPKIGSPPTQISSLGPFLSAVQVAIADAILTAEIKLAAATNPQSPAQNAASASERAPAQTQAQPSAQPQAQAQMHTRLDPGALMAPTGDLAPGAPDRAPTPPSDLKQAPQAAVAYAQNATTAPVQNPAQAIALPFLIPQLSHPVQVRVERQEEDGKDGKTSSGAPERAWRVSFSLDAGGMGLVHVSISLHAGAVSVKLAAEDAQAASDLRAWVPELKTALEASNLTVEEISARQGTSALDPPPQGHSLTI